MEENKLSVKSFAFASALLWGGGTLFVGVLNLVQEGYGQMFLSMLSSIYPGYDGYATVKSVAIVTTYVTLEGAIGGCIFAWLYNFCACRKK